MKRITLTAEQRGAVARWKGYSEEWDLGKTNRTHAGFYWQVSWNPSTLDRDIDRVCAFRPHSVMLESDWMGDMGESRPLRSTVAALIAAMIETGDDPAHLLP